MSRDAPPGFAPRPASPLGLRRHFDICNNTLLPGGRLRLEMAGRPVGWVPAEVAARLDPHGAWTNAASCAVPGLADLARAMEALAAEGAIRPTGELFDIRDDETGAVLGQADRGCFAPLGLQVHNVHLNGLVRREDGLHVWVARRAAHKQVAPGKLDNIVAGGVPAGLTPRQTLIKEAAEEAGLPAHIAQAARPAATISYVMQRPEGLRRETLHCFDLDLPPEFRPVPVDGEVADFALWPIGRLVDAVTCTDDVMYDVNLVLIDLFSRCGLPGGAAPG